MRQVLSCLFILQLCCVFVAPAADFWQHQDSPWGGNVSTLLILENKNIMISLTGLGVFVSEDDGESWFPGNPILAGKEITGMVQVNNSTILLSTYNNGLFITTDNGSSWQPVTDSTLTTKWFLSLAAAPDKTVYAGSMDTGVFKSTDSGGHWEPVNNGLPNTGIKHLATTLDGTVFAGTVDYGIYRLRNTTEGWLQVNSGLTDLNIFMLKAASNDSLYAGLWSGGLYSSGNYGQSWKKIQPGEIYWSFQSFAEDLSGGLYVSGNLCGIYTRQPGQLKWQLLPDSPPDAGIYSLACTANGDLIAGTRSSGIFRRDRDQGWKWCSKGLSYASLRSLAYLPSKNCYFAAVQGVEMLRSKDGGASWEKLTNGLDIRYAEDIAIDKDGVVFVGAPGWGIYRSEDSGDSWMTAYNGLSSWEISTLFANPSSGTVLAGQKKGLIDRSEDHGVTWTSSSAGLPKTDVNRFAMSHDNRIYTATYNGLFESLDDGKSWQSLAPPMGSTQIRSLAVTGKNHIYAGTYGSGLWRSKDKGQTWEDLNVVVSGAYIYGLAVDSEDRVYVAPAQADIVRSDAEGENWQSINSGMGTAEITFLTYLDDYMYAGTLFRGLYRSTDPVTNVDPVEFEPVEQFKLEQNFPNPFNPSTTIQYHLTESGVVQLDILDIAGRHVRRLVSGRQPAGTCSIRWDRCDDQGYQVASGIYIYRLSTPSDVILRKMVVVK
jgi:photosystem II stability/assembly factor-like uncharacterized protein